MAKGKKTGGRTKGAVNKLTAEAVAKAAELGITPLDVMLQTMKAAWEADPRDSKMAMDAAQAAAPYVHPKLAPVDSKTGETARFVIIDPCN